MGTKQPLRIPYDGASDKTRINFNGTTDYLYSENNCPLTRNDLTIFYVGKVNALTTGTQRAIGYRDLAGGGSDRLNFGIDDNTGRLLFKATDDTSNSGSLSSANFDVGTVNHIACAMIKDTEFSIYYNDSPVVTTNVPLYSNNDGFNLAPFTIGHKEVDTAGNYWGGDIQEVIMYNRALNSHEVAKIQDYLNKKYRIY